MKSLVWILCIGLLLPFKELKAAPAEIKSISVKESLAKPKKYKAPKRKKGFLWGLFKKKDKGCGCPNH